MLSLRSYLMPWQWLMVGSASSIQTRSHPRNYPNSVRHGKCVNANKVHSVVLI
jgi:hypothetical protein